MEVMCVARIWVIGLLGLCSSAIASPDSGSHSVVVQGDRLSSGSLEARVSTQEARTLPGLSGDAVRAVEFLAGVARTQLGAGQLIVWGAAPSETRILWEGIELPTLYHLGGLRAVLPTNMVESITLLPAGYGAAYGRGLGGVLSVNSASLPDGFHGEVRADLLDASAQLSTSIGSRFHAMLAGRFGYVDKLLPLLTSLPLSDFFPLPSFWDAQAQVEVHLQRRNGLHEGLVLRVLGVGDSQTRIQANADEANAQTESISRQFYRVALEYFRKVPDHKTRVTPWIGIDEQHDSARFGGTEARLSQRHVRYGLRASHSHNVWPMLTWDLGADVLGDLADVQRDGTLTRPPREGDRRVFGQNPGREVSSDSFSVHQTNLSVFSQVLLRLGRIRLTPSLRAVAQLSDVGRLLPRIGDTPPLGFRRLDFALEPRLQLRIQPTSRLALFAAAGLFHQTPDPVDLSAVFGNPTLGPARAVHAAVSAEVRIAEPFTVEMGSFFRGLFDLWSRSPLLTPPLARSIDQEGTGRAYGGHIVVRLFPFYKLSGTLSYSLSRAERRDHPKLPLRLADFDQLHVLQVAVRYVLFGWGMGVRLRYASGLPRTEVIGAYYDARDDRFDPLFGATNAIRLPDFFQLDAQIDRTFVFAKRLRLSLQLEVQNVTARQNAEDLAYRYDYSQKAYILGMPLMANVGARFSF